MKPRCRCDIVAFATQNSRYGYRRIAALPERAGWIVKGRAGLAAGGAEGSRQTAERGRLWLNDCLLVRLRPERHNHVWCCDFVDDRPHSYIRSNSGLEFAAKALANGWEPSEKR
jgi:hypothetical protein